MNYDFTTLSPEDFEHLAADLLSAAWGVRLEVFKPGKDQGIDLRHSRNPIGSDRIVVQCKRTRPDDFPGLLRKLERDERPKLERLNPERYVLVTSTRLSPANKDKLLAALSPWCGTAADIIGADELNRLLVKHSDVETAHFKLWISSTNVMERVLNARIFNITEWTVESLKIQMSRLVVHQGLERCLEILKERHHCIIAGNPGIGKTTLARMALCHYLQEGFTPIVVVGDVGDAWQAITQEKGAVSKKVVLYDDFLGQAKFDDKKFGKNEDLSLMELLTKVGSTQNLRFILTTREYVLADAQRLHEGFARNAANLAKCVISIDDYVRPQRARVLFNHLYFSDLPTSRLDALIESRVYIDLVDHKYFNPRVVETVCKFANSRTLTDAEFVEFVRKKFEDPSEVWSHPFLQHISPTSRRLLVCLWSMGDHVEIEQLKEALSGFMPGGLSGDGVIRFRDSLKELDGNFVSTTRARRLGRDEDYVTLVSFHNPSVEEFVERFALSEPSWVVELAESACFFQQLKHVYGAAVRFEVDSPLPESARLALVRAMHRRGKELESRHLGETFNYGHPRERVFSPSKFVSEAEVTAFFLKVALAADSRDPRWDELVVRVTTRSGWIELLSGVELRISVARQIYDLIAWVFDEQRLEPYRPALERAFRDALLVTFENAKTSWIVGLREALNLRSTFDHFNDDITEVERAAFERLVEKIVDYLEADETDADSLEYEVLRLKELMDVYEFDVSEGLDRLESAAGYRREQSAVEPDSDPDEFRYQSRDLESARFDIDSFFEGLRDRD